VKRLAAAAMLALALSGCTGCVVGRPYIQESDGARVCLDP
jgi:hypothetical protein